MPRLIELTDRGWFPDVDQNDTPIEMPNPLEEMERLARSIVQRRASGVESVLDEGRRRLQHVALQELNRLAGEMMIEVSLAETPRGRLGRAIAGGAKLLEARPADHLVAHFADPDAFVARCRAACQGLVLYVVGALNESLVASGEEPLEKAEMWVKECARELHLALTGTAVDGVDRKAQLSLLFANTLKLPREEAPRR